MTRPFGELMERVLVSATVEAPDRLRVTVEVAGWPAPLGALEWLLRAAGALDVAVDEPASDPQGR